MADNKQKSLHLKWAYFRHSVVSPLLSSPPDRGELQKELAKLAEKIWKHPISGEETYFKFSTIEEWYYRIRREKNDPISVLARKERLDKGTRRAISTEAAALIKRQYSEYPWWTVQLHAKNVASGLSSDDSKSLIPSYSSVLRYMRAENLRKRPRPKQNDKGELDVFYGSERRETSCFEVGNVNEIWSLDFHHGGIKILDPSGVWRQPLVVAIIDHCSRLVCHAEWLFSEKTPDLVNAVSVAIMKRGRPRKILSDNGSAMRAGEFTEGLKRLGVKPVKIKPRTPKENGKSEAHWNSLEGQLVAMLIGHQGLTLKYLNDMTQAWYEMEYNRSIHREIKSTPLDRFISEKNVGLNPCDKDFLDKAFRIDETRRLRKSDGTIRILDVLFRIPQPYWSLPKIQIRYARWNLNLVHLVDYATGLVLARIYPVDKVQNSNQKRRSLDSVVEISTEKKRTNIPAHLEGLIKKFENLTQTSLERP